MQLWSQAYIPDVDPTEMTCLVEQRIWEGAHENLEARRLIAEIRFGEQVFYAAVSPIGPQEGGGDRIFAPQWILDQLGADGCGEEVTVAWRSEEFFPEATRLVLRPRDSAFYYADAREELERALTRIGVLRAGSTIKVPLQVLAGYEIEFDVMETEPADIVLMQGDEVALEFEEALDGAAEAQNAEAQDTEAQNTEAPDTEAPMLTPELRPQSPITVPGYVLGGENRRTVDGRPWNPWRQ